MRILPWMLALAAPIAIIGALATVELPKAAGWRMHVVVRLNSPVTFETSKDCLQFTKTQEVQMGTANLKAQLKQQLGDESRFTVEVECTPNG